MSLGLTCVVDDHDICEADEVVESDHAGEGWSGVAAHVPKDHRLWLLSVRGLPDESSLVIECGTHRLVPVRGIARGCNVGLRRLLRWN